MLSYRRRAIPVLILTAAVMAGSAPGGQAPEQAAGDAELIARADAARTWGTDPTLPTIDEFVDMACSDCADFHMQRGDSLMAEIVVVSEANFVVRIYPIPRLLRGYHAAEALLTAGAIGGQAGFQGMLALLLSDQHTWADEVDPRETFTGYAGLLDLPVGTFRELLDRDAMAPLILSDFVRGQAVGVTGTPTFVFNPPGEYGGTHKFYGNQPIALFEEYLRRVGGAGTAGESARTEGPGSEGEETGPR